MQVLPLEEEYPPFPPSPNNPSNEESIDESVDLKVGSVAHLDHNLKGVIKNLEEGIISSVNPPLTDPIHLTLVELPYSTHHFD